jgi:hypothetical protein
MAPAGLTSASARPRRADRTVAFLRACGLIWAVTLATAAAFWLIGEPIAAPARAILRLRLSAQQNPRPDLAHVLALLAHNTPIAGWPLLLGPVGADRRGSTRALADVLVLASMLANAVPVGAALGVYGGRLLPYLPQLPLEWAALPLGYASWPMQRRHVLKPRERVVWLGLIVGFLLGAATLETVAVPHR